MTIWSCDASHKEPIMYRDAYRIAACISWHALYRYTPKTLYKETQSTDEPDLLSLTGSRCHVTLPHTAKPATFSIEN